MIASPVDNSEANISGHNMDVIVGETRGPRICFFAPNGPLSFVRPAVGCRSGRSLTTAAGCSREMADMETVIDLLASPHSVSSHCHWPSSV